MSEIFFSCQPIFNEGQNHWGNELLFREGQENKFPSIDEDTATSRILSANFLSGKELDDSLRYVVSFSEAALLDEIPFSIPVKSLVICVTAKCNATPMLVKQLESYQKAGFTILGESDVFTSRWQRHLHLFGVVRVSMATENLSDWTEGITNYPDIRFLASKVESNEEFVLAKQLGFSLFQGYFFEQPVIKSHSDVAPSVISLLDACIVINRSPHDIDEITEVISRDVSLLYKVVTSANILAKSKKKAITNPKQAVVYLGLESLRRLISLLIMSNMNHQECSHLQNAAILRAIFMQQAGPLLNDLDPDEAFLVGAFSLLDAMLGVPMEDVVEKLSLNQPAKLALLSRSGPYGDLLELCKHIEHANWDWVGSLCEKMALRERAVLKAFEKARYQTQTLAATMQV
ncbi:EAL and HDOD domain-containing protein [Salinivibrio kushneri]|uniref:EAL and HDOD domain-containing protein n=1 Tax=Salinivibrio kushneri TaxID=1908198 RepID=UPI00098414A5|nr:HDOD domain-containing protein [Salinivibrio kushneri]OOE49053.1 signal transduction protein [Salinivibrio kushneri]OOE50239.1 signal transduction protein [Salinivibrio kushneri]OOE60757.1 signal transduction protein [Salinivibrio kushneri]